MKPIQRTLMGFGGLALAAASFSLAAPKTAHAVVAALVQVANTAAAPVIAQDVSKLASQNISFASSPAPCPGSDSLHVVGKDGQFDPSPYTVPAGQTLVITSVDFFPDSAFSFTPAVVLQNPADPSSAFGGWAVQSGISTQFSYPSGIAIGSGISPALTISQPTFTGVLEVSIHGYLTAN